MNVITSFLVCGAWGYLLYVFEIGRLWLMMGIANQLLATIGLAVGTTYLLQHSPKRVYALCTGIPFFVVAVTVFTAGIESLQLWWGQQALPTLSAADAFSYRLMCGLVCAILLLGGIIVIETVRRWYMILSRGAVPAEPQLAAEESA